MAMSHRSRGAPGLFDSVFGRRSRPFNPALLAFVAAVLLSLAGIYAIDLGSGMAAGPGPMGLTERAVKQAIFVCVGIVAALVVALPDYRRIRLFAWAIFALSLGLLLVLVLPFVPASIVRPRNGVRAWIDLGPIDLQPTELVKIAWIMVTADYLRYRREHRELTGLIRPALITFIPIALIMLQPDLGSVLLFIPTLLAVLVTAGMRFKHLALIVLAGTLAVPASYPLLRPYQKERIVGLYRQLTGDKSRNDDVNYQSVTAISLIGAGRTAGNTDAKTRALVYYASLPERHNDMILAVWACRFGLLGTIALLATIAAWVAAIIATAALTRDPFGRLICVGFASMVAAQALLNTGMVAGVLPIVGVTLPFVSYGGSSMLTVWLMTGLAYSVAVRPQALLARPTFEFKD
ncbi:MAG: FtsW/RodA/SpoVE family cell cycle protein [Phycisphaerales bacterium]|nr:FtsW/RodA/SpoVE family cell cycle protein [Phycisphaerales bacterium]